MKSISTLVNKNCILIYLIMLFTPTKTWGQVENFLKNNNSDSDESSNSDQIPCNTNTFWVCGSDSIIEFSITNSIVTPTGINYSINNGSSLSFANNNSPNASLSPTFYTTKDINNIASLWAFNGSSWDTVAIFPDLYFVNSGGHGNSIYIDGYSLISGSLNRLFRYTNSILDTIYTCPLGSKISVADIAIDFNSNIYLFTGPISGPLVDTLVVLTPSGSILNTYPISFNSLHAYGSFIMGDTIYVGFGISNPLYSSTVVPIIINQANALMGTPSPIVLSMGVFDMESCNPGVPLGLNEAYHISEILHFYPNPASTIVTFQIPNTFSIPKINLISSQGYLLPANFIKLNSDNIQLQVEDLPSGLYFVQLILGNKSFYGKFNHLKH